MAECILAKYGDIDVSEPPVPTEKTVSTSFRMNITTFNNKNYYPTFRLNLPTDYTYLAGWQLTSTDVTITTAKSGSGESNLKLGSYWYVTFKGSNLQSITQRDNFLDFSMGTRYTAPQTKLVGGTWGDLQSFARQAYDSTTAFLQFKTSGPVYIYYNRGGSSPLSKYYTSWSFPYLTLTARVTVPR